MLRYLQAGAYVIWALDGWELQIPDGPPVAVPCYVMDALTDRRAIVGVNGIVSIAEPL